MSGARVAVRSDYRTGRRTTSRNLLLALAAAIVLVAIVPPLRNQVLLALGAVLTHSEAPQKADAIEVLGGDLVGDRILAAAELAKRGYAPKVVVSGIDGIYGKWESDDEVEYAVAHGYSRDLFVPLHVAALNTVEEARKAAIPALRQLGVHKYLLVTSDFHTGRAARIFRREAPDLEMHVISVPSLNWHHGYWWQDREGRKQWLQEMAKNLADFVRM